MYRTLSAVAVLSVSTCLPLAGNQVQAATTDASACSVVGNSLAAARQQFAAACEGQVLRDCDPAGGTSWQCSSQVIGANAPGMDSNTTLTTSSGAPVSVALASSTPSAPASAAVCYAAGATLRSAITSFDGNCQAYDRQDCDPIGGQWICSSSNITADTAIDQSLLGDSGGPSVAEPAATNSDTGTTDGGAAANAASSTAGTGSPSSATTSTAQSDTGSQAAVGRLGVNDLLVLHYDNCPDKDDGHAIAAGKAVVEVLGINRLMTANGTCGNSIRDRFNAASHAVMQAAWGNDYLDADGHRAAATITAADAWAAVLSNGGHVWVAEGGQSDFTADIVRRIAATYASVNLRNIHVVQHSAGSTAYNEKFTDSSNLGYLKNTVSYKTIPTGNVGGNGSADLNSQSAWFVQVARSGSFSTEWTAGFNYLKPDCAVRTENCKLDFSDTVELLYIVDDTSTLTVDQFAYRYLR